MAVYTEVSIDEAARTDRPPRHRRPAARSSRCAGGIENTNYFADTTRGPLRAHAFERLTADRAAVLPAADEAPRRSRPAGARAARRRERRAPARAEGQAGRRRRSPAGRASPGARRRAIARASARCSRACTWRRADFALTQPNLRGLDWWNETVPVVAAAPRRRRRRVMRGRARLPAAPRRIGGLCGAAARRDPRRPVPRQRDVRRQRRSPACSTSISPASTRCCSTSPSASTTGASTSTAAASTRSAPRALVAAYEARAAARERRAAPAAGADARRGASASGCRASGTLHLPRDASVLTAHDPTHFERVLRAAARGAVASGAARRGGRAMKLQLVTPRQGARLGAPRLPGLRAPAVGFAGAVRGLPLRRLLLLALLPVVGTSLLLVLPPAGSLALHDRDPRVPSTASRRCRRASSSSLRAGRPRLIALLKLGVVYAAATCRRHLARRRASTAARSRR